VTRRLFGLALLAGFLGADARAAEPIKVLIIDGQNNHDWRKTTPHMKQALEACGRFTVDVATAPPKPQRPSKPKNPTPADDQKYEAALAEYPEAEKVYKQAMAAFRPPVEQYAAVLLNYNGDAWPAEFQAALDAYVKEGKGGLVIVHAANNSFSGWKDYDRMIGLGWRGNSYGDRLTLDQSGQEKRVPAGTGPGAGHGSKHPFLITVRDREHPITKGMPAEWTHSSDELYHGLRGPAGDMHLLATAYSDKSKGGTGEHEPMIWTVTYGQGRVFHTPMGHDLEAMRCPGFIATLQRGTEWAATGAVTLPLPPEFPAK
jgi:type 1 glutamine amidotransferase